MKLFFSTFVLILLSELGDKSQITSFSFASRGYNLAAIIIGSTLALATSTLLAVLIGDKISKKISGAVMKKVAGFLFIVMGVVFLTGSLLT
ncbi:MAG: TMEM165/GDT1 family protein [Spirochaetaceae bacterium]|nr:TMEM165/GDT1 family protein [Spirochaetaceae bacterium]